MSVRYPTSTTEEASVFPRLPFAVHFSAGAIISLVAGGPSLRSVPIQLGGLLLACLAMPPLLIWLRRSAARSTGKSNRRALVWLLLGVSLALLRLGFDFCTASQSSPLEPSVRELCPAWPETLEIEFEGCSVAGSRRTSTGRWVVILALNHQRSRDDSWTGTSGRVRVVWSANVDVPGLGDCVAGRGELHVSGPRQHPFAWDSRASDDRNGVEATIFADNLRALPGRFSWRRLLAPIDRFRVQVETSLIEHGQDHRGLGWLLAVGTGSRAQISPLDRERMNRTGMAHLLAVSGLHLALVVVMMQRLLVALLSRSRRLSFWFPPRIQRGCLVITLSWSYVVFTGMGTATIRAALFLTLLSFAQLRTRRADVGATLALTAALIGLYRPAELFGASLQLSVVAVAAILIVNRRVSRPAAGPVHLGGLRRYLASALWTSTAVQLALVPVLSLHFGVVSASGVLANVLVAPVLALVLVSLASIAVVASVALPQCVPSLCDLAEASIEVGLGLVEPIADRLGDPWVLGAPATGEFVAWTVLMVGLVLLLHKRVLRSGGLRLALLGAVVVLSLAALRLQSPQVLEVWFLPVGHGDATVLRLPSGHTVLIDAGGRPAGSDPGRTVVTPFLRGLGVQRLDLLVLTHTDYDHVGGVAAVAEMYPPREVWLNESTAQVLAVQQMLAALPSDAIVRQPDELQSVFHLGETTFELLHPRPPPGAGELPQLSENDNSLCLRVVHQGQRLLLVGDVEIIAESMLISDHRPRLRAEVLKVPHHGSSTSSSQAFLDAVWPDLAVFSVGLDNRFGLPDSDIEMRYRRRGIDTRRTDLDGAVRVQMSEYGVRWRSGPW